MDATQLQALLASDQPPKQIRAQLLQSLVEQQNRRAKSESRDSEELERCRAQLDAARRRNREIAAALGACPCFGAPRCRHCGGAGAPGTYPPDSRAFAAYVEPVLRQLGLLVDDEPVPNQEG